MIKKEENMNNVICRIEKSGNRYNAWSADGTKWTSEIGTGTRKRAFEQNMAIERRTGKNDRVYWWKVPMENYLATHIVRQLKRGDALSFTFYQGHIYAGSPAALQFNITKVENRK